MNKKGTTKIGGDILEEYRDNRGLVRIYALLFCYRNGTILQTEETALRGDSLTMLLEGGEEESFRDTKDDPEIEIEKYPLTKTIPIRKVDPNDPISRYNLSPAVNFAFPHCLGLRIAYKDMETSKRLIENLDPSFFEKHKNGSQI
jgi:hypothetical protein